ncbi:Defensin-like protein [Quillaja saponaria]|uniref:Defensin-like protein n=1 Tax=Quillaja saponaria TaxID=32244 RepID=A0AAD7L5X7_QUISA|nr:Defensin-like protein [Quillaja saponaria]
MTITKLHLLAALVTFTLLVSRSIQDPAESDLCNFEDAADIDEAVSVKNVKGGCHFGGACNTSADCNHACAALDPDPKDVQCIPDPAGGNRCCCLLF